MAAQEYKYISLRDILKKEKFPKLNFFKYSPSESEEEHEYPCVQTIAMPPPSPFAFANSLSDVPETSSQNSSRAELEKKKRVSDKHLLSKNGSNSGINYKGKLLAAPVSSLKRSKSDQPLIYQTLEGNGGAFILDGVEISFNISFGSWDEKRFKLALLYDDSEDEEELQMKKEEDEEKESKEGEEVAVVATNN
ncbi:Uncharacterized protein Adt_11055 [Abeliophyllum distichum]|uniref:Uncharacterized protein n=1 Tax=Abeliophyllum distichum TaxID=126358 RepID=A0ABD1ULR0_9LAMI